MLGTPYRHQCVHTHIRPECSQNSCPHSSSEISLLRLTGALRGPALRTKQGQWGHLLPATRRPLGVPFLFSVPRPHGPCRAQRCTYRPWAAGLRLQPGEQSLEAEQRLAGPPPVHTPRRTPGLPTRRGSGCGHPAPRPAPVGTSCRPELQPAPPHPLPRRPHLPTPPRPLQFPGWLSPSRPAGLPRSPVQPRLCLGVGFSSIHSTQRELSPS